MARGAGGLTVLAAVSVLTGWALGIEALMSVLPGQTKMSPLTALTFALAGSVLWLSVSGSDSRGALARDSAWRKWVGSGSALIALIGAYRLCDYGFGWNLAIDQLGFEGGLRRGAGNGALSLMAPATAVGFLLLGSALTLVRTTRLFGVFQALCLLVAMSGWLGISHYIFGGEPLLPYTKMAFHTAILLLVLSAGTLCARADRGLVALLRSDSAGGSIARKLVPAAVFAPVILGWLRLEAQRAGWIDTEAGISLFALSNIVVFGGLIWATALSLHRADIERRAAQRKVHAQLERLKLLEQITHAIGERQDLLSIFQVVVRAVEEQLPADFVCACRYDETNRLLSITSIGLRSQTLALTLEPALSEEACIEIDDNGLSRSVHGELVYEPDLAVVNLPFAQRLVRGGLASLVLVPLVVETKVFGLLVVARGEARSFSSADCEFLRQLGAHTALAANQVHLYAQLRLAYEDLRQSQQVVMQQERLRVLGQMASGIAHDINNALSPVALYTDSLLANERGLSEKARAYLETIRQAIEDAAETIGRLRQFYGARQPETILAPVLLNSLVEQVVNLTRARWSDMPRAQGIEIRLDTELAADLPAVLGSESEIRDALVNLVFNAVDAMPGGGVLTMRTRLATEDGEVDIEVCDSGTGMDEATVAKCLEPFFTTKGERGTGLGLAMVYGMAQRHGGRLAIESAVGRGTTMRLSFPVAPAPAAGPSTELVTESVPMRLRILLVDDDPLLLQSLKDALEGEGHTVEGASGGEEGIDRFRAASAAGTPFAVVITDLGMPYVDGKKVALAVKAVSPATPVIMLTGWGRPMAAEAAPPMVDRVLAKPPKLAQLRETLARCCNGRSA
ncbi:MAG TPA: ATP-binding protein [Steroidobacteraceae bacterium]|nr:ATP-binding protein [Steroidobacteraceae bacterium]